MKAVDINQELTLSFPESFSIISEEELGAMRVSPGGEGVCLKSEDLHIVITIGWRKEAGFFGRLLAGDNPVENAAACYKKKFRPYGYVFDQYMKRQIGEDAAEGLRYSYEVRATAMTGETFALKQNGRVYYFHVYYRSALQTESREIWSGILASAKWLCA